MSPVRSLLISGLLIALLLLCAGCTQSTSAGKTESTTLSSTATAAPTVSSLSGKNVRLETTMGNITIALDPDMPITAGNFETLVQKGYYNGVIFHRVINGFMIQGGDPTGTGRGGPGYTIQDEFTSHNKNGRGAVAMANTGQPNSGGSQFFINLVDNSALQGNTFDNNYPVFGNVIDGMDVVDAIGKVQTGTNNRPLQNVTIIRAVMV
ncbi:MAG: peptidylprolyl isomerase [Methanoregula sp.]|uniref:peptidylprolyl isomerase n=1 Tax=Methanoregula sp. TaxID=2052170 RepID=UPI003C2573D8